MILTVTSSGLKRPVDGEPRLSGQGSGWEVVGLRCTTCTECSVAPSLSLSPSLACSLAFGS